MTNHEHPGTVDVGAATERGEILWRPGPQARDTTAMGRFPRRHGFQDYHTLQAWSIGDLDRFWAAVTDELGLRWVDRPSAVLAERAMPGARWFPGATLNYVEHMLAAAGDRPRDVAVIAHSQ